VSARYANYGPALVEAGYDITPVKGKAAYLPGWTSRPPEALNYNAHASASIGVLTGGTYNLVAIDVDILCPFTASQVEALISDELGEAPRRIGNAPKSLFLFRCTEPFLKTKTGVYEIEGDDSAVEVLGEGQQFVASGVHPDTLKPYRWPDDSLIDLSPSDLTVVTAADLHTFLDRCRNILGRAGTLKGRVSERKATVNGLNLKELEGEMREIDAALAFLPNDDEHYDDWIGTLHGIKGAVGEDGRELAHRWSKRSEKYDEAETDRAWDSIKNVKHIGAGSIYHWASQYGFNLREIREPQHEGPHDKKPRQDLFNDSILRASEIRGPIPEREWLLRDWFPSKAVSLLFGPGGVGKTLLIQQLANCVATGVDFMGIETSRMPVLAVLCEDDSLEISRRQLSINDWLGVNEITGSGPDNLFIWPRVGEDNILVTFPSQGEDKPGEFYGKLRDAVEEVKQRADSDEILIVLDTAADLFGGNENVRREVNTFVKTYLSSFCVAHNATVITLAHPSLSGLSSGTGMSGSTAWENSARARAYFHRSEDDDDVRTLSRKKSNYSAIGDSHDLTLLWQDGVYQLPTAPDQVDRIENNGVRNKILDEIESAFIDGAGYKARGPRAIKSALPKNINSRPNVVMKLVRQMESEGLITLTTRDGYKVLKRG
jgi:hypothetical protein